MIAAARTVTCGFCAKEFVEDRGQSACGACPLNGGCRWIRCPHCGYDNPETPRWMEHFIGKRTMRDFNEDGVSLPLMREGARARVVGLEETESPATAHLVALGVLPGAELTLVQRYPAFVVRIGNTEIAVDHELARRIIVR